MGIRFHCPNGHKLNVKSFLAGKKGACPDCGVKLRIPDRSEPGLDSGIDEGNAVANLPQHAPAAPVAPLAKQVAIAAPVARPAVTVAPIPAPVAMPAMAQPVRYAPQAPLAMPVPAAMPPPYTAPSGPIMPPPPPPMAGVGNAGLASDPITENPLATWFVRPPSGGQFGPARGEVMRKWVTEGRVTADSLVWREGWADWLAATEVFPTLGKSTGPALFGMQPGAAKSTAAVPLAKKPSSMTGAAILAFLAVICLILVAVLAVLLSGGMGST